MPWDSLKKRLSSDSFGSRKRDQQQQPQRLAQHDQSQRSPQPTQHAFAAVVDHVVARSHDQRPTTSYPSQTSTPSTSRSTKGLAPDVYKKIKEIDQEPSTLTSSGIKGLSARILERNEFSQPMPDGTIQHSCYQTVEIYKRPGQSLGLYLREGNGDDRFDGIFISRLQEMSDLEKSGVLHVGDEILSVNKVDVTQRNIDEVVVMISIPRRLILQMRTIVDGHGEGGILKRDDGKFIKPIDSTPQTKPIAIIKQLPRDESKESTMTDDGAPLASSQLIATAQTSLGVRARQQESASSLSETPSAYTARMQTKSHRATSSGSPIGYQPRPPERVPLAQRSLSERWGYVRPPTAMHPRSDVDTGVYDPEHRGKDDSDIWQMAHDSDEPTSSNIPAGYQSTLERTAYLPPPRIQSHLPILERAAALSTNPTPVYGSALVSGLPDTPLNQPTTAPAVPSPWNPTMANTPLEYSESPLFSPRSAVSESRLALQHAPRSALRQPSAFPTSIFPSLKSNSLPRRNPAGRTIKWRNDVMVGGSEMAMSTSAMSPVTGIHGQRAEASDSDGAVSAPELALSPRNPLSRNPYYQLQRTPSAGKTIDELFSRTDYQAWNPKPIQPPAQRRFDIRTSSGGYTSYPEQRYYDQPPLQQGPIQDIGRSSGDYGYYFAQSTGALPSEHAPEYWTMRRLVDDRITGGAIPNATIGRTPKARSTSLPPRGLLNQNAPPFYNYDDGRIYENVANIYGSNVGTSRGGSGAYAAVDISPLPRRRLPLSLAAANPSFGYGSDKSPPFGVSSPMESVPSTLTGILLLHIIEGRQIRSRNPEEMYCVVEIDGEHRARTEVSDWHATFHWNELFEIDVWECRRADFYIYSWHPQYRHKLRYRGFLQLVDTLLAQSKFDQGDEMALYYYGSRTSHSFALNLDPHGQLFIQVGFQSMAMAYKRQLAVRRSSYFGVPLQMLVERESINVPGGGHVPTVLRRLVQEIERRGVDTVGLYVLCGSASKKFLLRDQLERDPTLADLSPDAVPDLNVLSSVLKDFLRELPEPLVPNCTFQMLLEAWKVCVPNDKEGNAKLMLGVIDCLSRVNKCTFMVLTDHLKYVISQSPHNGLSAMKCGVVFGPLIFCTSQAHPLTPAMDVDTRFGPPKPYFTFLDHRLAARLFEVLMELWPSPRTSSESSGSENSTMNLTGNGDTSLVNLWLQENRLPESTC